MNIPAYFTQDRIARIESVGVQTVGTNVVYSFRNHRYLNSNYNGIVIVLLQAPPAGATTQTVVFNSGGGNYPITTRSGAALTAADLDGAGVYLLYYNSDNGSIQFIA